MENDYRVIAMKATDVDAFMTALTMQGFDGTIGPEGLMMAEGRDLSSHLIFLIRSPYTTFKGKLAWDYACKITDKLALAKW